MTKRQIGIFIFDDVEVLDFAGPFEVFSRARLEPGIASRRSEATAPFNVFTVAPTAEVVRATGNLRVIPDYDFHSAPRMDLLIVPGGFGTRALLKDERAISWLKATAEKETELASVCTGALLLARAGLLRDRRSTTHFGALDLLNQIDPSIVVERNERVVQDTIFTSAGVASGIDLALALVERWHGHEIAEETARYIEFPRTRYSVNAGARERE